MTDKVRKLTRGALLASMSVALLCASALFPTLSLTIVAISGLTAAVAIIHDGLGAGAAVYAATAALAAIIAPDKGNVILFAGFFGLYPVLKSVAEKPPSPILRWAIKLVFFNIVFVCVWIFARELLFDELPEIPALWLIAMAVANCAFVVYDVGLDRLISLYMFRIARKIDKKA